MKFARTLRRKFGISAPRMTVRTHMAWYWNWLLIGMALAFGMTLAGWMFDIGARYAGFNRSASASELTALKEQLGGLQRENGTLRAKLAETQSNLQIELSARKELAELVKGLQDENATLKDDIAFFRTFMTPSGKPGAVSLYRFRVEHNLLPGEYRYRLLLLQSGQRDHDFQGTLQLVVNTQQEGRRVVVTFPRAEEAHLPAYKLAFKYYQRVEGTFHVDPEAVVKSVQVRVFEQGSNQPRLMQTVNL
jgi:hypothetical protein